MSSEVRSVACFDIIFTTFLRSRTVTEVERINMEVSELQEFQILKSSYRKTEDENAKERKELFHRLILII